MSFEDGQDPDALRRKEQMDADYAKQQAAEKAQAAESGGTTTGYGNQTSSENPERFTGGWLGADTAVQGRTTIGGASTRNYLNNQLANGGQHGAALDQTASNQSRGAQGAAMALGANWAQNGSDVLNKNAQANTENAFAASRSAAMSGGGPASLAMRSAGNQASQMASQNQRDLLQQQSAFQQQGAGLYAAQANQMRGQDLGAAGQNLTAEMQQRHLNLGAAQTASQRDAAQLQADSQRAHDNQQAYSDAMKSTHDDNKALIGGAISTVGSMFSDQRIKAPTKPYHSGGVDPSVYHALNPVQRAKLDTQNNSTPEQVAHTNAQAAAMRDKILRELGVGGGQVQAQEHPITPPSPELQQAMWDSQHPTVNIGGHEMTNRPSSPEQVAAFERYLQGNAKIDIIPDEPYKTPAKGYDEQARLNLADRMSPENYKTDIAKQQAGDRGNSGGGMAYESEYREAFNKPKPKAADTEEGETKPKGKNKERTTSERLSDALSSYGNTLASDEKVKKPVTPEAHRAIAAAESMRDQIIAELLGKPKPRAIPGQPKQTAQLPAVSIPTAQHQAVANYYISPTHSIGGGQEQAVNYFTTSNKQNKKGL